MMVFWLMMAFWLIMVVNGAGPVSVASGYGRKQVRN